jgi:hypothetical protein
VLAFVREHVPVTGNTLSCCLPRSSNVNPEPTTRSRTVLETSTTPESARAEIRTPMCTARPAAHRQMFTLPIRRG